MYLKIISNNEKYLQLKNELASSNYSYKKILRIITKQSVLLTSARFSILFYGTNGTKKKHLPVRSWDRQVAISGYTQGLGKFEFAFKFILGKLLKILDIQGYVIKNGMRKEQFGIVAYLQRNCDEFYKKGITVLILNNPRSYLSQDNTTNKYFSMPVIAYSNRNFIKLDESIKVDKRIVELDPNLTSFIALYIPSYGVLELTNIEIDLENDQKRATLASLLDRVVDFINIASYEYYKQKGHFINEHQKIEELNEKEQYLRELGEELRIKEADLDTRTQELEKRTKELFETNIQLTEEKKAKEKINRDLSALQEDVKNNIGIRSVLHDSINIQNRMKNVSADLSLLLNNLSETWDSIKASAPWLIDEQASTVYTTTMKKLNDLLAMIDMYHQRTVDFQQRVKSEEYTTTMDSEIIDIMMEFTLDLQTAVKDVSLSFMTMATQLGGYFKQMDQLLMNITEKKTQLDGIMEEHMNATKAFQAAIKGIRTAIKSKYSLSLAFSNVLRNYEERLLGRYNIDFRLHMHTEEEGKDVRLPFDGYTINRMLENFLLNSLRKMQEEMAGKPGLFIEISTEEKMVKVKREDTTARPFLIVHIKDNGPGVPTERKESIFEGDSDKDDTTSAHGEFLTALRATMKWKGGFVKEVGKFGEGAHFILGFPLDEEESTPGKTSSASIELGQLKFDERIKGKRALVVDDDAQITDSVAAFLRSAGLEVDVAYNGVEGFAKLSGEQRPDLIVSDVEMPILDGKGMLTRMTEHGLDIPYIIASGTIADEDGDVRYDSIEPIAAIGTMIDSLVKPVDLRKLFNSIQNELPKYLK